MVGTFDVPNFGDLLFPLIARRELEQRLGPVEIRPYSYHARDAATWPFAVTKLDRLAEEVGTLDLLIVGGGDIVRFDALVALDYGPETPDIHHPTGFWLAPVLMAHAAQVPVAWNAPGVPGEIPEWACPLVRAAIAISSYVCVRDEASRERLVRAAAGAAVDVVPDTGFNAGMLLTGAPADGDTVVVQSRPGAERWLPRLRELLRDDRLRFVITPVGPVTGDLSQPPAALPPGAEFRRAQNPLELLEWIAASKGVAGPSLHLTIAALSLGKPALRPKTASLQKYRMLDGLAGVHPFDDGSMPAPDPAQLAGLRRKLQRHWDSLAALALGSAMAERPKHKWQPLLMDLWQSLPARLERTSSAARLRTRLQTARARFDRVRYRDSRD